MGDFNAHVQGYYSDDTNINGKLLLELCKNQSLSITPFQGPTFERGTIKTAVDYILLERESYDKMRNMDILDRQYISSDHHIL